MQRFWWLAESHLQGRVKVLSYRMRCHTNCIALRRHDAPRRIGTYATNRWAHRYGGNRMNIRNSMKDSIAATSDVHVRRTALWQWHVGGDTAVDVRSMWLLYVSCCITNSLILHPLTPRHASDSTTRAPTGIRSRTRLVTVTYDVVYNTCILYTMLPAFVFYSRRNRVVITTYSVRRPF